MIKIVKFGIPTVFFLGLISWAMYSVLGPQEESQRAASKPRPVLVSAVLAKDSTSTRLYSSTLRARKRAQLAFSVPGRVGERLVELGDKVERGQLLARLETAQFRHAKRGAQAAKNEADARLQQLKRDAVRVGQLHAKNAASREELEKVNAAMRALQARLGGAEIQVGEAQRMLSDTRILAPFAGTITHLGVEVGEYAQPGQIVFRISGLEELEAEIELPESSLSGLEIGGDVEVSLPILGIAGLQGHLRSISRGADAGHLFSAIVSLNSHESLLPGVTAEFRLHTSKGAGFSLPIAAILSPSGGATFVYRVNADSIVEKLPVVVRGMFAGQVQIQGAFQEGDSIVVAGHANLSAGQKVDPRPLSSSPLHSEFSR